ncbi:hypothetical protein F66182_2011 [Fusarium sp. NRRL 66182]|nr:hypothetical protein F66182_2011 [Fusarium sp. NRRL 66182]
MANLAEDPSLGLTYTSHRFIHGGAWRDPRNDENDFTETIKRVVISGAVATLEIAGFISIDYRLSPHPDFPRDSGEARHPDHVQDIWSALNFLQDKYELSNNYILVGHSAGATLAFQLLMGDDVLASHPEGPLPTAIIAVSSIVDLVGLNDRHDGQYAGFIQAAFGEDKSAWEQASPARFSSSFKDRWASGKLVILAWSSEDTLIDEPEIDSMASLLSKQGLKVEVNKDLRGEHDFVWQDGSQVARLVITAIHHLRRS